MSHLVSEETLETLTYERSKVWSNFLKSCEDVDEGQEIALHEMEDLYKDPCDESFVDFEEAIEDEVEEDIDNATASMSKAELTQILCSDDNKKILDETLPIVEEHVRKWKAAGLERILNTFDAVKIERHVGDWLRRHNSAYGEKSMLEFSPAKAKMSHKRCKATDRHYSPESSSSSNDSETESMHSVDTAQYIRASRKRTVAAVNKCGSPMTTIKMYRTLPRKRDELRAKYGCDDYNEELEHRHHMQALLRRRDQMHRRRRERERELIYHTSPRHYPYSVATSFSGQHHRRKQLRKRRDSSPHFQSSTSSSEEERGHSRCDCSACVRRAFSKTSYPYCRQAYRSYHSHSYTRQDYHQRLDLGSRTMHSMHHFKRSVLQLQRQQEFEKDLRPRLMESECSCCNKDRLCSNIVHIANSSTEEWLVENKSSSDSPEQNAPKECALSSTRRNKASKPMVFEKKPKVQHSLKGIKNLLAKATISEEETEDDAEEAEKMKELKPIADIQKTKAFVTFVNVEEISSKDRPKSHKATLKGASPKIDKKQKAPPSVSSLPVINEESIKSKIQTKAEESHANADITKVQGRKPAAASKSAKKLTAVGLANKTLSVNCEEETSSGLKAEREASSLPIESQSSGVKLPVQNKRNGGSKAKPIKKNTASVNSNNFDSDLKLALEISKKTFAEEQLKLAAPAVDASASEQSSFNNQSVACNSTALSNHTACGRALKRKQTVKPPKRSIAANNSGQIIDLTKSDSSSSTRTGKNQSDGDADCTLVTSTTGCDKNNTVKPNRSHIKITKKGILLYAPSHATTDQIKNFSCSLGNGNGNFTLTESSLSPIIGQQRARKFFMYHIGSLTFDGRYSVYFRPSAKLAAELSADANPADFDSSSSSSDDDIFDRVNRYGEVYTVLENSNERD